MGFLYVGRRLNSEAIEYVTHHVQMALYFIVYQGNYEELQCSQVANPAEITGLAFAESSGRLAVCNRNAVVQMFTVDARMILHVVFSVSIEDYVPKMIAFAQSDGRSRNILLFRLHDGKM